MPGQAVLRASLRILDLPTKLNGPMEENAFAISFQDHLTLSGNSIQLKMEKSRGHCPRPLCITTYQQEVKLIYKHLLWVFFFPRVCEKVPAARAEGNHPNSSIQWVLAKMNLEVKASGKSKTRYGLELSSDF